MIIVSLQCFSRPCDG